MKKLTNLQKMALLLIACIALSAYSLYTWSYFAPLSTMSYMTSVLIHIATPMLLGYSIFYKNLLRNEI